MKNPKKLIEIHTSDTLKVPSSKKIIVFGLVVLFFFFGFLGTWAAVANISGAIIAPGTVVVGTNRKLVQHREGGIVDQINVSDGDVVEKGEVLVVLRDAQVESNVEVLQGQLSTALAKHTRLVAEREKLDSIPWPEILVARYKTDPDIQKLLDAETKVFESNRIVISSQLELLASQIEQTRKQIEGLNAQIKAEDVIIETLRDEYESKNTLYKEDYIGKLPILELQRTLASHEGRVAMANQAIAEAEERIAELELKRTDILKEQDRRVNTELSDAETKIIDLRERLNPQIDAKNRLEIKAPVNGIVVNKTDFTVDSVIKSGETILEIVPEGDPLIVESAIQLQDIAEVYKGQPAKIQLNAFDLNEYKPVRGEVTYVSADSVKERYPQGDVSVFKIHLEINQEDLEAQNLTISPGMPVTAFVTTKDRTVLGYLFEPITKRAREAFRD
ncbi:MAG: HlyD family type I secretion periplasmic adaptor subunit [Oceanidesulfovibrio sp.]